DRVLLMLFSNLPLDHLVRRLHNLYALRNLGRFDVPELDEREIHLLAHEHGLEPDRRMYEKVQQSLWGHPYLLALLFAAARSRPPIDAHLEIAHSLRGPLAPFFERLEKVVRGDAKLFRACQSIAQGDPGGLTRDQLDVLVSWGVVDAAPDGTRVRPRPV